MLQKLFGFDPAEHKVRTEIFVLRYVQKSL